MRKQIVQTLGAALLDEAEVEMDEGKGYAINLVYLQQTEMLGSIWSSIATVTW